MISSIYGSSPQKVKNLTGLEKKEIKKIRKHFMLDEIKKEILESFNKKGYFFNMYGRPITNIHAPVNYWLQSSAADYSCLAFLNFIKRGNLNLKAVIHDAVIIETDNQNIDILKKVNRIHDPISNIKLNVEHSIIN